jgi:hypothetical protein
MRHCLASALLLSLVLSQITFGQSSNASVGGFVQDASRMCGGLGGEFHWRGSSEDTFR